MEHLKKKLALLPDQPGIYMMKNSDGKVIYIGKAKVLKNRVRSYFTGSHDQKTQKMVSEVSDFEYILTLSEVEALLLECNLIKEYNPQYNIMLRDDKSYPYILITTEKHPRILVTRKVSKKMGRYFGPYPNATAARETARLLNRLLPLRKCRQLPNKTCLYYHIGQCLGPCIHSIDTLQYDEVLEKAQQFLKGNQKAIVSWLNKRMQEAAERFQFEAAKEYRDLIQDLNKVSEKQNITLNDFKNRDIVAYTTTEEWLSIQIFRFRQGKLTTRDGFIFPYYADPEESYISFLVQYYSNHVAIPEEICTSPLQDTSIMNLLPITTPKRGKVRELIQLAQSNAKTILEEKLKLETEKAEETQKTLTELAELLKVKHPDVIESFDISSLSGTNVVAGMVQFKGGRPSRSNYRKYHLSLSQLEGNQDDTAFLKQVITRRYSRLLKEEAPFPDLILVDGGKGHVKAALLSLGELKLNIPVAGMVKDDHHQTRSLINSKGKEIPLHTNREVFLLIQRIQEEVHRFAITFHRQQRAKHFLSSVLDDIPGVGPKRKQLLLKHFKSMEKVKVASVAELLEAGLPTRTAEEIYSHFLNNK